MAMATAADDKLRPLAPHSRALVAENLKRAPSQGPSRICGTPHSPPQDDAACPSLPPASQRAPRPQWRDRPSGCGLGWRDT
eukprot:scaffold21373_cov107-Isochrysis_galbana.AAC.1